MPRIWKRWRDQLRGQSPEEQTRRQLEERALLGMDYRFVFGTEAGQRVLADILHRAGLMADTYDAHPPNAAYAQGKRRVALDIIELLNADPADRQRLATTGDTEELFPITPPKED
jgi:hypothetical protein